MCGTFKTHQCFKSKRTSERAYEREVTRHTKIKNREKAYIMTESEKETDGWRRIENERGSDIERYMDQGGQGQGWCTTIDRQHGRSLRC